MAMPTTLIAYLPSSSSSAAAAMVGGDQEEEEEDNLASLMPNFFKEFVDMNENEDDTDNNSIDVEHIRRMEASENVMKQAHAFKEGSCAGSSAVVKPTSKLLTSYYKRNRKSADGRGYQQSKKAPIFRPGCHSEKENVLSNANLFCKRGILRREGSGRTITRRPFKVDLRNFKSIMNQDAPQDSPTLEDVHAFWVAEDTKEAMMQILKRERVTEKACHQQSAHEKNGNIRTRNACMRRKGSGRRTTFRDFKVELPRYADSLASLDKEQLEEEEDEGPVKSHAFVDDLELQIRNETQMSQTNLNFVQTSQATGLEANLPDGTNQMSQEEHVMHTMYKQDCHKAVPFNDLDKVVDASLNADAEIVITRGGSPIPSMNEKEIPEFQHFDHVCAERCYSEEVGVDLETVQGPVSSTKVKLHKPVSEDVKITIPCDAKDNPVPASSSAEKSGNSFAVDEAVEIILEDARKVTPFFKNISRNLSTVFTPGTSPTPPSNPLAALGLRKENMSDLIGKRRLHFGSSGKFLLPTQVIKATATSDIVEQSAYLLTFPEIMAGKKKVEVLGSDIEPSIESPSASSTCTSRNLKLKSLQPHYSHHELSGTGSHKRKGTLNFGSSQRRHKDESPKECDQPMISAPCDGVEVPITFGGISEQHIEKTQKVKGTSRKTAKKLRNSLAGSGTRWDGGVRRSTRIKSRPLEFWKGERFLYGRVHQSLTTVVGIKYSCSSLCWQQGEKVPNFKVESFVPDEYAEYVRFAALY